MKPHSAISQSIRKGIALIRGNPQILGILFSVNLVWSACLALPLALALFRTIGHLGTGDALRGEFAYIWWNDFADANLDLLLLVKALMIGSAVFYLIINIFLIGGILPSYRDGGGSLSAFFGHCGGFFLPLIRLSSLALMVVLLLLGAFYGLGRGVNHLLEGYPFGRLPLVLNLSMGLLLLGTLVVLKVLVDYWRISIICHEGVSLRKGLVDALRFVSRYPLHTFGLYGSLLVIGGVLGGTYLLVATLFSRSSLLGVVIILIIQQAFIFGRIVLRLLFLSAQTTLYRRLLPDVP